MKRKGGEDGHKIAASKWLKKQMTREEVVDQVVLEQFLNSL